MRVAVTGAFGYSGKYITRHLLAEDHEVLALTNSLHRAHPFGGRVTVQPFNFERPELLANSLRGVAALINTYWVRFDHRLFTHAQAVANTRTLFDAAKVAGVQRIVHLSITNPDLQSDLPYFRGKAELELALQSLGLSYCILRPTVLFGKEDILINNIAWGLRRFPIFGVFGVGDYQIQPIYVDDLAAVAAREATKTNNHLMEAIGPETFTYRELVAMIAAKLGLRRRIISVPPTFAYWVCRLTGVMVQDVIITREEIRGLMENRLFVNAPALGWTTLSDWVTKHAATLGLYYTSEMRRRLDRQAAYRGS